MSIKKIIARLELMERVIDSCLGKGTVNNIIETTLENKNFNEILFEVTKKKGERYKNDSKTSINS